ncbi:hypothetical protein AN92_02918, partial [Mycobacterium tuberculosis M1392]
RQTQNPERGRKLAGSGLRVLTSPVVVRPKTPRGDGNPTTSSGIQSHGYARSSDPKPREGTETCIHSSPTRRTSASRQTQNPERGRKLVIASRRAWRADCRQTQNPERGRKLAARHGTAGVARGSSDPKPREGTETGQRSTPALVDFRVVRPKTPRGDGNMGYLLPARGDAVRGRQTQNPERGRKHGISAARPGRCCPRSSDPKPREGTETCAPSP